MISEDFISCEEKTAKLGLDIDYAEALATCLSDSENHVLSIEKSGGSSEASAPHMEI